MNLVMPGFTEMVLPKKAIEIMPFSPEPLEQWNDDTDIYVFLEELYDASGYAPYADYRYHEGNSLFLDWSEKFAYIATSATPAPGSKVKDVEVPNFSKCEKFGLLAKNMIAWSNITSNILSEDNFLSVAHLLESVNDLNASITLSCYIHYKQANQILRAFLEGLLLQLYFSYMPAQFDKWKEDDFRPPSLRGDKGILQKLSRVSIISPQLLSQLDQLIILFNKYIHGVESKLNNNNAHNSDWIGSVFNYETYSSWISTFSDSIYVGTELLKIQHAIWCQVNEEDRELCSCGKAALFYKNSSGKNILLKACRKCDYELWLQNDG